MIKRMDKFSKLLLIMIFSGMIAIIPITLIAFYYEKINTGSFPIVYFALLGIVIVICAILFFRAEKIDKKEQNKLWEEAKIELKEEAKEVILNDFSDIPKKYVKCHAQVNEDGKIICKIRFEDFDVEFESYEKFLKHFSFVEK